MSYDPTIGRWMETDPAGYIDGPDTYQFVDNNLTAKVDATGLAAGATTDPAKPAWSNSDDTDLFVITYGSNSGSKEEVDLESSVQKYISGTKGQSFYMDSVTNLHNYHKRSFR